MSLPAPELSGALLNRLAPAPTASGAPPADGEPARFDGVDLRAQSVLALVGTAPPAWWDDSEGRVRVPNAALAAASLRSANLSGVCLEHADFRGADLANAVLAGAILGGADFSAALLEDADLREAHLRFANFHMATLEGSDLRKADLWGAKCQKADLDAIDFRGAELEEADLRDTDARKCDFRGARLGLTDFRGANLQRSDFREAELRGTKFDGADLRMANFANADLSDCTLAHAFLADARLERTRIQLGQIGGAIGEEIARDFDGAARGYLTLERNFTEIGDPEGSSWAYRRRRRMTKFQHRRQALQAYRARKFEEAGRAGFYFLSDWLVEVVCDYGESVPRVLMTQLAIFLVFGAGYWATGAIDREARKAPPVITTSVTDAITYSMAAMVAPGNPPADLRPASSRVELVTMVQSALGIFLIGLLGFVAGNRIRR